MANLKYKTRRIIATAAGERRAIPRANVRRRKAAAAHLKGIRKQLSKSRSAKGAARGVRRLYLG